MSKKRYNTAKPPAKRERMSTIYDVSDKECHSYGVNTYQRKAKKRPTR